MQIASCQLLLEILCKKELEEARCSSFKVKKLAHWRWPSLGGRHKVRPLAFHPSVCSSCGIIGALRSVKGMLRAVLAMLGLRPVRGLWAVP